MAITQGQLDQFERDGFFTTDVLFDADTLETIRGEFERLWAEEIASAEKSGDARSLELARLRPFIGRVHLRSGFCRWFCHQPVFQEICRALIGADADLYYNQAVCKPPGKGRAFAWHQDNQYGLTDPLEYVTCWIAIGRATVDNGTIWLVPGLHKRGLLPHVRKEQTREWECQLDTAYRQPVVLRPGQMAVFSSLLPHASGPNTSDDTRYAYVVQYHHAHVKAAAGAEAIGDQEAVIRGGKGVRG